MSRGFSSWTNRRTGSIPLARERGVTVFMSSHILAEVDRLATRVGIVHRGRLIEELDTDALELHRDQRLEVGARHLDLAEQVLRAEGFEPRRRIDNGTGALIELREPRAIDAPEAIATLLVQMGALPTRLAVTRETLEDHFIRVTRASEAIAAA
jgi:ABC-2 type transport system ATP-binding protein